SVLQPCGPVDAEVIVDERVVSKVAGRAKRMFSLQQVGTADGRNLLLSQELRRHAFITARPIADRDVDSVPDEVGKNARRGQPNIDVAILPVETIEPRHQPPAGKAV